MASNGQNDTTGTNEKVVPVEKDPEVEVSLPEPTPTPLDGKRSAKDSDPIPEKDWMDPVVERPYAEAITPAHREFLAASGFPVPELKE